MAEILVSEDCARRPSAAGAFVWGKPMIGAARRKASAVAAPARVGGLFFRLYLTGKYRWTAPPVVSTVARRYRPSVFAITSSQRASPSASPISAPAIATLRRL